MRAFNTTSPFYRYPFLKLESIVGRQSNSALNPSLDLQQVRDQIVKFFHIDQIIAVMCIGSFPSNSLEKSL